MESEIKFLKKVLLVDVAFLNDMVYNVTEFLSERLGRELPKLDLPGWLSYLALDAGLREGDNEIQVLLIHNGTAHQLKCCEPSDLESLHGMACRTPLGEFVFSVVSSSGMVSDEELFVDLMSLALDSADVERLMLVPFQATYGEKVEEKLRQFFRDRKSEEQGKAVYFTMQEPLQPILCQWDFVNFSLMHALGIKSDEL